MYEKAENWNYYNMKFHKEYGAVAFLHFTSERKDIFKIGDNDYNFVEEIKK